MKYRNKIVGNNHKLRIATAIALILLMLGGVLTSPVSSYAEGSKAKKESANETAVEEELAIEGAAIREAHKVKVKNNKSCFFVTNNVVLTPAEISAMTDEKLVATVIARSGLYMKKSNCTNESNKMITPAAWIKKGGSFWLDKEDIKEIRAAKPKKGSPKKLYMDLKISTDHETRKAAEKRKKEAADAAKDEQQKNEAKEEQTVSTPGGPDEESGQDVTTIPEAEETSSEDVTAPHEEEMPTTEAVTEVTSSEGEPEREEELTKKAEEDYSTPRLKYYSTYKKTEESLLFVVVATAADAKEMPAYCTAGNQGGKETDIDIPEPGSSEPEEILPEYRTIEMVDRSGAPIPAVLQEGSPVTLTWEGPKYADTKKFEDVPAIKSKAGVIAALLAVAAALLIAATVAIMKRRNAD